MIRLTLFTFSNHYPIVFCNIVDSLQVVVQYDKDLLEVWDEAKRLRCEWFNDYEKTASKPPMVIADLDVIQLDFRGEFGPSCLFAALIFLFFRDRQVTMSIVGWRFSTVKARGLHPLAVSFR